VSTKYSPTVLISTLMKTAVCHEKMLLVESWSNEGFVKFVNS